MGKASYYDNSSIDPRWGGITKGGDKFDENEMTAAVHPERWKEMKGKTVRVRNNANGKSVDVKINDTGGFKKYGREIDLSKGAFKQIADPKSGVIDVTIEPIDSLGKTKGIKNAR
jgi:rare lipoprotein A